MTTFLSRMPPESAQARDEALSNRQAIGIAILLVAAGLGLRLVDLGSGLWYDEIVTLVRYARSPLGEIVQTYDSRNQHMLYSLLAHVSIAGFGESAWALRLPAALLGAASIGALFWFGSIVAPRVEAVLAAGLLTVSYHHVWFSQNARGYTGLLLATLVSTGLLLQMVTRRDDSRGRAAAYAVTGALAVYMHLSAALVLVAHAMWLAWRSARGNVERSQLRVAAAAIGLAIVIAMLLFAPVLGGITAAATGAPSGPGAPEWRNPLWLVQETVRGLARGLPGGWLTAAGAAAVAVAGTASYWRRPGSALALMLAPVAMTAVVAAATGHNLWPRLFFFAAGFGCLIVVRGFFALAALALPRRAGTVATAAALLLIAASAMTVPRAWQPKQDFSAALAYVERFASPGESVVITDMTVIPFRDYHRTGWTVVESREDLARAEAGESRTWAVLAFPRRLASARPDLWNYIGERYEQAETFAGTVGGGEIIVMRRR